MFIFALAFIGLMLVMYGLDMQTLKTRDRRFRSGYRDTGIEANPTQLMQGTMYSGAGAVLMLPLGLVMLTQGLPLLALGGGIVVWGTLAFSYMNASRKLSEEKAEAQERQEANSRVLSSLEHQVDQNLNGRHIIRTKTPPVSDRMRANDFRTRLSYSKWSLDYIHISVGHEWWGDHYIATIETQVLSGEAVLRLSQKRRDGSSANGQTLIHHDILLTAENIIIVQALHLMSEHQSEFERLKAATPRFSLDMQFFAPQFFAVPYSSVGIDLQPQTLEKEEYDVPQGADVINRRYKYTKIDGTPDRRYKDNPFILTCYLWAVIVSPPYPSAPIRLLLWRKTDAERIKGLLEQQKI